MMTRLKYLFSALLMSQKRKSLVFYWSNVKNVKRILNSLKQEGFISHFQTKKEKIKVFFKQDYKNCLNYGFHLKEYEILLKPISNKKIWKLCSTPGVLLLSTNIGILPKRFVKIKNVGGMVILYIK